MEHGAALVARKSFEFGIGLHRVAGQVFVVGDQVTERGLAVDVAQDAQAADTTLTSCGAVR